MKKAIGGCVLAAGLLAAAAPPAAEAASNAQVLTTAAGRLFVTTTADGVTRDYAQAADGTWVGFEVLPTSSTSGLVARVSHSASGLVVHSITDGTSNTMMVALFRSGSSPVADPPFYLVDPRTHLKTAPAAVRTLTLDPGHSDSALVDAGHLFLTRTGEDRGVALVQRSTGEVLLVDFGFTGAVRRTSLGFTPPIGSNKGSFTAAPDGHAWATLATALTIRLMDLGDLSSNGALAPKQAASLAVGEGFDPGSTRVGIIAILIGLLTRPAPSISYQVGDEVFLQAVGENGPQLVARQKLQAGAVGLLGEGAIYYELLPYIEQENLFRGFPGFLAVPFGTIAY